MTTERLVSIARKVWGESAILPFDDIERFARLVRNAALEEAAETCVSFHANGNYKFDTLHECAGAIRNMKENNA